MMVSIEIILELKHNTESHLIITTLDKSIRFRNVNRREAFKLSLFHDMVLETLFKAF